MQGKHEVLIMSHRVKGSSLSQQTFNPWRKINKRHFLKKQFDSSDQDVNVSLLIVRSAGTQFDSSGVKWLLVSDIRVLI